MSAQRASHDEQAFKDYFSALCRGEDAVYASPAQGIQWEGFYAASVEQFQSLVGRVSSVEKIVTDSTLQAVLRLGEGDNLASLLVKGRNAPHAPMPKAAPPQPSQKTNAPMTDEFSRSELEAKLERTEARVDLRLSEFNSAVKDLMSKIQIDIAGVRADIASSQRSMTQDLSTMKAALADEKVALATNLQSVKDELAPLKLAAQQTAEVSTALHSFRSSNWKTIWGAAGTVILALIATLVSLSALGFSAFESGRNTAVVVRDAQQKIDEAAAIMAKHREDAERILEQAKRTMDLRTAPPASSKPAVPAQ